MLRFPITWILESANTLVTVFVLKKVLIAIGANAGASIPRGRTALMLAASGGHFLIVEVRC